MESYRVRKVTTFQAEAKTMPVNEESWPANLAKAKKLVPMLSAKRAERRNEWMLIGWVLFNTCGPGMESLELWIEFSKRCPSKFDYNTCIHEWSKMSRSNLSMGTLCMYASMDNPTAYGQFRFDVSRNAVYAASTHYDIAMLMFEEYGKYFKCASVPGKKWYVFEDCIWKVTEDGIELRKKISEIIARFERGIVDIREDAREKAYITSDMVDKRIEAVQKTITKLKSTSFKECVMRECAELHYDETFESKLDNNVDIIAFNNGVYDLFKHEFRPGLPSDYLSKKMSLNYEEFDEHDPRIQEVNEFLEKIFPDTSIREYFLNVTSTIFRGSNTDKKVFVWTGDGDNGKSVTEQVFEKIFGPYAIKLPTTLLTGKRTQSSAACPELSRAGNGIRWAVLQEPDSRDELNVGLLKELSGNDTYFARDLYQRGSDMKEITPMFKLALICNEPPSIPRGDRATWERIRVIPFESTFVNADELPETYEEQLREKKFAKDPKFYDKIPNLLAPFAWMLLQHYKKIGGKIGPEPEKVKLATNKYKEKNDVMRQYLSECVEEHAESVISLTELYASFKLWYKEGTNLNATSLPSRFEFGEKLCRLWGDTPNKMWKGYRFRLMNTDNIAI